MKLLIITQKVDKNDPILGFFHSWLMRFALQTDEVFVIANEVRDYDLPKNVEVHSLVTLRVIPRRGRKEKRNSRLEKYLKCRKLIKELSKDADGIFVHMCPEYAILAWLFSIDKKILMWYVHKSKNLKLWVAEKMVDKIFTVSKNSCRIKSKKIEITGHGVDVDKMQNAECRMQNDFFNILSVGRISPIKDYKTLIRAMCYLVHKRGVRDVRLTIIGDAYIESDLKYKREVEGMINGKELGEYIKLVGSARQDFMPRYYYSSDMLINLCPTGGMDKVVFEASACELPVLVANKSFEGMVGEYRNLIFEHRKPRDLAEKILLLRDAGEKRREIGGFLREQVVKHHNLTNLIEKITKTFQHS